MEISEKSRVWIYQADRAFNAAEEARIAQMMNDFTSQWAAHGHKLAAYSEIRYQRFIILMVDEQQAGATGCSIDKSVQLMKEIEQEFNVNLFDRFNIAYKKDGKVLSCGRTEFEQMIEDGEINGDLIVFNNLVQTKQELDTNWEIPVSKSWHARIFSVPTA